MGKNTVAIGDYTYELKPFTDKKGQRWLQISLDPESFIEGGVPSKKPIQQIIGERGIGTEIYQTINLMVVWMSEPNTNGRYTAMCYSPNYQGVPGIIVGKPEDDMGAWISINENAAERIGQKLWLVGGLFKPPLSEIENYFRAIVPKLNEVIAGWKTRERQARPPLEAPEMEKIAGVSVPAAPISDVKRRVEDMPSKLGDYTFGFNGLLANPNKIQQDPISETLSEIAQSVQLCVAGDMLPSGVRLKPDASLFNMSVNVSQFVIEAAEYNSTELEKEQKNRVFAEVQKVIAATFETTFDKGSSLRKGASISDIAIEAALIYERVVHPERAAVRETLPNKAFLER